jgi:hypothetical protein
VLIGEVMGQTGKKELLDAGVAVTVRHVSHDGLTVGSERVCHVVERSRTLVEL